MGPTGNDDRALPPFRRAAGKGEEKDNIPPFNYTYYGVAPNEAAVLGFRILFADGKISVIQYHDLISPLNYDGAGKIDLTTLHWEIKITGKNLMEVFLQLSAHRLLWIKEPDSSFIDNAKPEPEIETIKIEKRL